MFQDYYFMSTSGPGDLHLQTGGYCKTHNMRLTFKVSPRTGQKVVEAAKVLQAPGVGDQKEEDSSDRRGRYEVMRTSEEQAEVTVIAATRVEQKMMRSEEEKMRRRSRGEREKRRRGREEQQRRRTLESLESFGITPASSSSLARICFSLLWISLLI